VVVGNYYGERKYDDLKKVVLTSLLLVSVAMGAYWLAVHCFGATYLVSLIKNSLLGSDPKNSVLL